jgi:outer membrane protein assembly factor BamB
VSDFLTVDLCFANIDGACFMRKAPSGPPFLTPSWQTGPINASTWPAVKNGLQKVWIGTFGGDLITCNAFDGSITRTVSFGGTVAYTGCHGGNLIVAMQDGRLIAIDTPVEEMRWSLELSGMFQAPISNVAVETNGILLVSPFFSGNATAIDAASGSVLWQAPTFAIALSANNGIFYIANANNQLEARSANDGSLIWSLTNPSTPSANYVGVTAVDDTVFASCDDGKLYAYDASSGAVNWSVRTPSYPGPPLLSDIAQSPVVIVPFGYGVNPGGLAAYEAATGAEQWVAAPLPGIQVGEQPLVPDMRFFSGLVGLLLEGTIFIYDSNGQLVPNTTWNLGEGLIGLAFLHHVYDFY